MGVFSMLLSTSRAISQAATKDVKRGTGGTGGIQVDGCWSVNEADTVKQTDGHQHSLRTAGDWVQYVLE